MKMKFCLFLATAVSASLFAQPVTNAPAPMPMEAPMMLPVATNKPAVKPAKKKSTKPATKKPAAKTAVKKVAKPAAELQSLPLIAGPAVVSANHVNVRTRPGMSGEVLTKLTNGEPVTVIEEIILKRSGPDEPSAWAKIGVPAAAHVWVKTSYVDAATKTVAAKKLNLRGGPGENYGLLGQLQHGDAVTEIETKGEWTKITPPTAAYAFMAAQYLSQNSALLAGGAPTLTPTPTNDLLLAPTTVAETPSISTNTTDTSAAPTASTSQIISNELAAAMSSNVTLAPPPADLPPVPRIVQREGFVRGNTSIQSPTKFELISPDNRKLVNYLFTTSTNLDLNRYKGLHIIVTGEEGMDERWKYTPVITIQRIQVIE